MKKIIVAIISITLVIVVSFLLISMGNTILKRSTVDQNTVEMTTLSDDFENIDIRISACNSNTHPQSLGLFAMKEYIEKESGGKIQVHVFCNGQLGDEELSLAQVQAGTLEMCTASIAPITTFQKKFEVLDIPFLFNNYEEAWMVLDSKAGQELFDSLESVNLKGLAWMENGFRHISTKNVPVNKMADLKGLKIRTMNAPMHILNFTSLGCNPTPINFSELYMAMSQNIVEGQENPLANVWDLNMFEVQKYVSLTGHIYDSMPLICNNNWWNQLPKEYQTIIQQGSMIGQNYSRFCNFNRESVLEEKLTEKGMTIIDISDEARQEMKDATQEVVANAVRKEVGNDFVTEFLDCIDGVRKEVVKGLTKGGVK